MKRKVLTLLLSAFLLGCAGGHGGQWGIPFPGLAPDLRFVRASSSSSPPNEIAEKDIPSLLKVGDVAYVTTSSEKTYRFEIYRVEAAEFAGVGANDRKYRVPYALVDKLVVERGVTMRWYVVTG